MGNSLNQESSACRHSVRLTDPPDSPISDIRVETVSTIDTVPDLTQHEHKMTREAIDCAVSLGIGNGRIISTNEALTLAGLAADNYSPATFHEIDEWIDSTLGIDIGQSTLRNAFSALEANGLIKKSGVIRRVGRRGRSSETFSVTPRGKGVLLRVPRFCAFKDNNKEIKNGGEAVA